MKMMSNNICSRSIWKAVIALVGTPLFLMLPSGVASADGLSVIVVPLAVKREVLEKELEKWVPVSESGSRDNVLGRPATSSRLSWTFSRNAISLVGNETVLSATTMISGFVRIEGEAQIIRGDIGKTLGKLNPTRFPFSAHADLVATASVYARPQLQSNWRLAPNISAVTNVTEASIPVADVATISVRGEVQPRLDEKLSGLIAELNAKLANDPFIELAAKKAWAGLCKAHKINLQGDAPPLWLVVKPLAAHTLPVRVDAEQIQVTVGITAETSLVNTEQEPDCLPLPGLTEPPAISGFAISVPVIAPYDRIDSELTKAMADKSFVVGDSGVAFSAKRFALSAYGERLKVVVDFEANDDGFLDWIFGGSSGSLTLLARPVLDTAGKRLSLDDITFDAQSDDILNAAGLAATLAKPIIGRIIKDEATIDLAEQEKDVREKANMAMAELKTNAIGGLNIAAGELTGISLDSIDIGADALTVVIAANGQLTLEISELTFKR